MRIRSLEVRGFGIWRDLRLDEFSGELDVVYGANEAGKTTLMQFVRGVFFGFSDAWRQRYLEATVGRVAGGALGISDRGRHYRVARLIDREAAGGTHLETLSIDDPRDGMPSPASLAELLGDVDETIFNNVFVLGLRDLEQLNTLDGTQAADWLYRLSAGIDRVSLVDVLHELDASRQRIVSLAPQACLAASLLDARRRTQGEIEELRGQSQRYAQLLAERVQLDDSTRRLDEEADAIDAELRLVMAAAQVREAWYERREIEAQLASLGSAAALPADALERFDAIGASLTRYQRRAAAARKRRLRLAAKRRPLRVNERLWRQAPRIEMLAEQREWLASEEAHLATLRAEVARLEAQLSADQGPWSSQEVIAAGPGVTLGAGKRPKLKSAANARRAAQQRLLEARKRRDNARQTARAMQEELDAAIKEHAAGDLTGALERAGERVSQLRRRVQADDRIDRLKAQQQELDEETQNLIGRQFLPGWVLTALGSVFAVGAALILASFLLPTSIIGSLGWALAILGLGGAVSAGGAKVLLERAAARQLETSEKQLDLVTLQLKQAAEERDSLDAQLPRGAGPLHSRLGEAEQRLATLEDLLPLDAKRQAADREAQDAAREAKSREAEAAAAEERWQKALVSAGLPHTLKPKQVRSLLTRQGQLREVIERLESRRAELAARQNGLARIGERLEPIFAETGIEPDRTSVIARIEQLTKALAAERGIAERRDRLRSHERRLRQSELKAQRRVRRLLRQRAKLLAEAGAAGEADLRERAVQQARQGLLRARREVLEHEIALAAGTAGTPAAFGELLDRDDAATLDQRRDELAQRLTDTKQRLQASFQRRGELNHEIALLTADRRLAERQLEIGSIDARLTEARRRWHVLTVTRGLLDRVRRYWERHRQPQALQEASGYLERLTQGRYHRVWTPLGENVLNVDDHQGRTVSADVLSRGTREQLFLSLRLALASSYAQRGARLPLVLDDVLVNFDVERAKAAAEVLRDFAAAGHQLLLFTCHEHIVQVFQSLGVPTRELPSARRLAETPTASPPRRKKKRRAQAEEPQTAPQVAEMKPSVESVSHDGDYLTAGTWPDEQAEPQPSGKPFYEVAAEPAIVEAPAIVHEPVASEYWREDSAEEFRGEFRERLIGAHWWRRRSQGIGSRAIGRVSRSEHARAAQHRPDDAVHEPLFAELEDDF